MISKTHISGQKPRGRQLNAKVCGSKSTIFRLLLCSDHLSNDDNSKTAQVLTLILARNGCSSQRSASQLLSVSIASNSPNKSHSQHSEAAVCWEGHHFLILYACAHEVSFPDRSPRSLIWKRAGGHGWHGFPPHPVIGQGL